MSPGATTIDGAAIAKALRAQLTDELSRRRGEGTRAPGLATVLVGSDPASASYVRSKHRACEQVGIASFAHELPERVDQDELSNLIDQLNRDETVDGILCQLPLPAHLDEVDAIQRISPDKDVDGLTAVNRGRLAIGLPGLRPCTPLGVMRLLDAAAVPTRGRHAVVIGRSNLVGKPTAQLLMNADATVTVCHSHSSGLPDICRTADIIVAAAGRPGLIRGDWVTPGVAVIDVAINRVDGKLTGDVCYDEVAAVASAITPVPGGVGPMTIACLLQNVALAAAWRRDGHPS